MDMSEYCEPGDCSALNLTSCEKLFELENESFVQTFELYDEDGCFHTHQLRETTEYETYLKVRWVGGGGGSACQAHCVLQYQCGK